MIWYLASRASWNSQFVLNSVHVALHLHIFHLFAAEIASSTVSNDLKTHRKTLKNDFDLNVFYKISVNNIFLCYESLHSNVLKSSSNRNCLSIIIDCYFQTESQETGGERARKYIEHLGLDYVDQKVRTVQT